MFDFLARLKALLHPSIPLSSASYALVNESHGCLVRGSEYTVSTGRSSQDLGKAVKVLLSGNNSWVDLWCFIPDQMIVRAAAFE